MASLAQIAREVAAEGGLPSDPQEAAEYVTGQIRLERPDVTLYSARKAAAAVVPGADPPMTASQERDALDAADATTARGRATRAARATSKGAKRAAGKARRRFPSPSNPFRVGARSGVGVAAQVLGLLVLYWLLRTPDAVNHLVDGTTRALGWLSGPGGVAGAGTAAAGGSPPNWTSGQTSNVAVREGQGNVERWRGLVAEYFPPTTVGKALRVMDCESSGNPNAVNPDSHASGLFQHLPKYWAARAAAAGFPGASIFDPEANIAAAAWLWKHSGWQPWSCGGA